MKTIIFSSLIAAVAAFGQTAEPAKPVTAGPNFAPLGDVHAHVCGIHFYSGDMKRQILAEHYCAHLSDEVLQCILYDSNKPGAKMIGVEYIVSAKIFETLPAEEKKLWHSHNYEVKSGVLTAPGMADADENGLLKVLIGTYGKTWQTWQIDKNDKIPMGIPQLMMAFTKDGQAKADVLAQRDQLYGSHEAKKTARAEIADFKVDPGADGWQKGASVQLDLKTVSGKK